MLGEKLSYSDQTPTFCYLGPSPVECWKFKELDLWLSHWLPPSNPCTQCGQLYMYMHKEITNKERNVCRNKYTAVVFSKLFFSFLGYVFAFYILGRLRTVFVVDSCCQRSVISNTVEVPGFQCMYKELYHVVSVVSLVPSPPRTRPRNRVDLCEVKILLGLDRNRLKGWKECRYDYFENPKNESYGYSFLLRVNLCQHQAYIVTRTCSRAGWGLVMYRLVAAVSGRKGGVYENDMCCTKFILLAVLHTVVFFPLKMRGCTCWWFCKPFGCNQAMWKSTMVYVQIWRWNIREYYILHRGAHVQCMCGRERASLKINQFKKSTKLC